MNVDDENPYQPPTSQPELGWKSPEESPADAKPVDLDRPVTGASFRHQEEAEIHRILLEQHGIRTQLADTNVVNLTWFLSNSMGGVKLLVAARDAEVAARLLQEQRAANKGDRDLPPVTFRCEECDAEITLPGLRRGHVETCPECNEYVDVPE